MTQLNWTPELLDAFAPSAERNPWGALESPAEALHGSLCFEVRQGQQRALMAIRPQLVSGGTRAEVTGLVSVSPLFHAAALDRAAVLIAHQLGADVLAFSTMVPKLAKAFQREGWLTTGAILTKNLGH